MKEKLRAVYLDGFEYKYLLKEYNQYVSNLYSGASECYGSPSDETYELMNTCESILKKLKDAENRFLVKRS